jgi:hypothetical protein
MTILKKRASTFNTGVAAEYFVLSQLYRLGLEAYISQGNKKAIDIRVICEDGTPVSLDVKSVRGYSSLVVNNITVGTNHFIVFVIYNNKFEDLSALPEVYIVPSASVPEFTSHFKDEKRVLKGVLEPFKDKWESLRANNSLQGRRP